MVLYVPALKAKAGELKAVEHLDLGSSVQTAPIWELPNGTGKKDPRDDLQKRLTDLLRLSDDLPQVDPQFLKGLDSPWRLIRESLLLAGGEEAAVVPVISSSRQIDAEAIQLARKAGLAVLRIARRLLANPEAIDIAARRAASRLGLEMKDIRIVADFGRVDHEAATIVARMLHEFLDVADDLKDALSVSVLLGSFPESLSTLDDSALHALERIDWDLYESLYLDAEAGSLGFGDYAVTDPGMRSGGRTPTPSIRYTVDRNWLVVKGRSDDRHDASQYHELADHLSGLAEFSSAEFSWGDRSISEVARRQLGPGNATLWRAYATNHHLTFVSQQLANLPVA